MAQAQTDDERFLSKLTGNGWVVSDEKAALLNAKANCGDLRNGLPMEVVEHTSSDYVAIHGGGAGGAAFFLKSSIEVYCPEFATTASSPTPTPTPTPVQQAPTSAYYPNCAAARAAGAVPIYLGEPGYSGKLDRDGDGIACE